MKTSHCVFAIAAVLGLAAGSASAAFITPSTYSGPGGTGADGVIGGNLIEPSVTFSSVDYVDVIMTVDASGSYNFSQAPGFGGAVNNTGQTWTGFSLEILGGGVGTFSPGWVDYPTLTPGTVSPTTVLFSSENVPTSTAFAFFGDFTTTGPGTVTIRETPIIAPVPEPSSFAVVGLGLLAVGIAGRRRISARPVAN